MISRSVHLYLSTKGSSLSTQKWGTISIIAEPEESPAVTGETLEFLCIRNHPRDWVNFSTCYLFWSFHLSVEILKSVNSTIKLNHAHSWAIEPRKDSDEVMFGEKQIALYQKRGVKQSRWKDDGNCTTLHSSHLLRTSSYTLLIWPDYQVDIQERTSCFSTLTSLNLGVTCPNFLLCCLVFNKDKVIRVFHIVDIQ